MQVRRVTGHASEAITCARNPSHEIASAFTGAALQYL